MKKVKLFIRVLLSAKREEFKPPAANKNGWSLLLRLC